MKQNKLICALADVEDRFIEGAAPKPARKIRSSLWTPAAACLALLLLGAAAYRLFRPVTLDTLLGKGKAVESMAISTTVAVGNRIAVYDQISVNGTKLKLCLGEPYEESWYRPNGSGNLKYLIRYKEGEDATLWVFHHFVMNRTEEDGQDWKELYPNADLSPYTYGDVYAMIYGVDSAEDIVSIKAGATKGNNTEFGKKLQQQVGAHTYDDRASIEAFYAATMDAECMPTDWQDETNSGYRFTYSFSTEESDKLTSGESTLASRSLTVTLTDGTTIDGWMYDALNGRFYEYGGIVTQWLAEEHVYTLNRIFGIS